MALNNNFTYDFEDRPKPKLWLLKPDFTRIERITAFSKLQGTFKYSNINQLTFQLSPVEFDELEHEEKRNPVFDLIQNKYLIEYEYNGYKDYFVIDDIKKISNDSDTILVTVDSLCTELNKKTANEIELLGSTLRNSVTKVFEAYAPLWTVDYIDTKLEDVKRELTMQNSTVMGAIDQLNTLFDSVAVFNNKNRKISFYHKDNVGVNRGLRIRENSYLKSFEDARASKDIITRLYPYGNSGLTIQSVNPVGTDYIEDFSYFIHPFKRDTSRNVIQHSNYMTDALCHALLDYQEFYKTKKEKAEELSKQYKDLLDDYSQENFKLNQLSATMERQRERKEILTPKSEYVDLGMKSNNFKITVEKSSYYILMLKNEGNLTRVRFQTQEYDVPSNDWIYIKIDTGDFQDALKYKDKLQYEIQMVSSNPRLRVILTRSSKVDFEDTEIEDIEKKYNYEKYKQMVEEQSQVVASIERRMKLYENEKSSLINEMNPKNYLAPELYKEREQYVYSAIWQEENHTEPKDLYEDAIKQMREQKKLNRSITIGIVNFVQSLEHKEDWNKLVAGDIITFSNKIFNEKLKAYITDIQINFEDNNVTLTISDVVDYKDMSEKVSELIASSAANAAQVNFHKEQIKSQTGKLTRMSQLIEAEWDANKKRILAGNETVDIGSHGVKVISNDNPNEFVIMVGGVIAMTKDGGETFKTGVTPNGVNAEMLIGKMIVGETLTFENESGTFRYDKDGLHIDSNEFHLTTNNGEDYFEKLKKDMRDENKVINDLIRDEFDRKINQSISEAMDIDAVVESAIDDFQNSFSDGLLSDIEKRLIQETLSTLEKENMEFVQQIEMAYNSQYILSEDIIRLDEALAVYNGLYESLVMNINEILKLTEVDSNQGKIINDSLIEYKEEVKEISTLLTEILERNRDSQINIAIEDVKDYAQKLSSDFKDEVSDLKDSLNKTNEFIESSFSDNIFDSIEIESIKTMLMLVESELGDIRNRHASVSSNPLLPEINQTSLSINYNSLKEAHDDFKNYVESMISDGVSDDTEKQNYKQKFDTYKEAVANYEKQYSDSIILISNKYADTVENRIQGQFNGLKEELTNDLSDLEDNIGEIKSTIQTTFEDSIVTAQEKSRIMIHLDMLDREFKDVEEQYKVLIANKYVDESIRSSIGQHRSIYTATHNRLRTLLTRVIEDGRIEETERDEVNQTLTDYSRDLSKYTSAITDVLNKMSVIIASDVAAIQAQQFSGVLDEINSNIDGIKRQVDGAIETFYYPYTPTLSNKPSVDWSTNEDKEAHIGDFFLDTKTGVAYRFLYENSKYLWKPIEDQVITDALNTSKLALDTADGKRRTFVTQPIPPYDEGDIWTQGASGDLLVAIKARAKGQLYVSTDWVKAVKYTDDSKANDVLSQLNQFKEIANRDLTNLKQTTQQFQTSIVEAFDDKVIELSEMTVIKNNIKMVEQQNKVVDRNYTNIIDNAMLPSNEKSRLTNAYSEYKQAYQDLVSKINSSINDNKISEDENRLVTTAFDSFNDKLATLSSSLNNALSSTVLNAMEQLTGQVEQRFETWKSSEFRTNSEQIAMRVSGSEWEDKYLPQINQKIADIDFIGQNLLDGTKNFTEPFATKTIEKYGIKEKNELISLDFDSFNNRLALSTSQTITVTPNTNYTLSYDAKTHDTVTQGVAYTPVLRLQDNGEAHTPRQYIDAESTYRNTTSEFKRYSFTFNSGVSKKITVYLTSKDVNSLVQIKNPKLEKGSKATPYSESSSDINNRITLAKKDAEDSAKEYADAQDELRKREVQAYADGKVTAEEQRAIADAKAKLELAKADATEKANFAEQYAKQHANNRIDNLKIGGKNLIRSYRSTQSIANGTVEGDYAVRLPLNRNINFYYYDRNGDINPPLEPNTDYVLQLHEADADVDMGVFYNQGRNTVSAYSKDRVVRFNTGDKTDFRIVIVARADNQFVGKASLYKGNTIKDWTPAPEDIQEELDKAKTTINANASFIEQNKDRITSSVTRTELETNLQKIATYEGSYTIENGESQILREVYGTQFSDNYSYEVVAKTKNVAEETLSVALFTSKGVGKGFDLTILDEKGTVGRHPAFELKNNRNPAIKTYQVQSSPVDIDVIYTKYLGTETNLQRVNSKIEQAADTISLEVKELKDKADFTNLLSNSNFAIPNAYWSDLSKTPNFSFPPLSEMSINTDNNLLLNNGFNNTIVGSSNYKRIEMKLMKPLEIGQTYTLKFDTENSENINTISIIPHFPESQRHDINISQGKDITLTFTATAASTTMLFYVGLQRETSTTATMSVSKATLVKGETPLPYKPNHSHRVVKMAYENNVSWPALASPFMPVGDELEYSIGDELTLSAYIYVPSKTKELMKSFLYIELAAYENTKQTSNPTITRVEVNPSEIIPDTWYRISATGVIPPTSNNGNTNYIRALLRYEGINNTADSNLYFYYGLPQLEKNSVPTKWTRSRTDVIDATGVASKISLTPESIEMISNNLRINTDLAVIENSTGSFSVAGDTMTLSNKNDNDSVSLSPRGITLVKDGVTKIENGYDMNTSSVQPYEPQFYSTNSITSISDERYNYKPHVNTSVFEGIYAMDWGTYSLGKKYKQLVENSGTAWARVNRYTYDYNKRYLVIRLSCKTNDNNTTLHLRWRSTTGGITLHEERITNNGWEFPVVVIDLEKKLGKKPTNNPDYFELQAHLSGATANYHTGSFRITRATMTDLKP